MKATLMRGLAERLEKKAEKLEREARHVAFLGGEPVGLLEEE